MGKPGICHVWDGSNIWSLHAGQLESTIVMVKVCWLALPFYSWSDESPMGARPFSSKVDFATSLWDLSCEIWQCAGTNTTDFLYGWPPFWWVIRMTFIIHRSRLDWNGTITTKLQIHPLSTHLRYVGYDRLIPCMAVSCKFAYNYILLHVFTFLPFICISVAA